MTYKYYWCDVFTEQIFGGNPLVVFPEAMGLSTEQMQKIAREFTDKVFQHEFDHLDGRLYIDHIEDPTNLVFEEEYERYILPNESAAEDAQRRNS